MRGPNSWVKWAYVLIRHFPIVAEISILILLGATHSGRAWTVSQCRDLIIYQLSVMEALTIIVEVVLIVRIYALYNRSKVVVGIVIVLFLCEIIGMITVLMLTISRATFDAQCLITSTPALFSSYWCPSSIPCTVLFALTLVKFFSSVGRELGRDSILFALVRDGTWAYAIIFGACRSRLIPFRALRQRLPPPVIMLLNVILFQLVKNSLAGACFFWEISAMSFAGSHMLLNLRKLAYEPRSSLPITGDSPRFSFRAPPPSAFPAETTPRDPTLAELQNRPCAEA
ncbi:hypothetical protein A0H81_02393 [Grifola frondosa]|uniref:Uncharacterized protein n=1 Tax=Grifola frondosa TaxID=5627 RepID=A0A1C7MPQ6_GRIFR|nr:hypothetical protein A0H81_02393 [Grifola frondosa]